MREKLATLPLSQLRELAKSQGIKYVSGLRKSELVDRLCEVAEKEKDDKTESAASGVQERTAASIFLMISFIRPPYYFASKSSMTLPKFT